MKTHPKKQNNASSITAPAGSLMQDNNNPIKYNVMSPDGFAITHDPFDSLEDAARYIPKWFEMFRHQGYYSAVGRRIPLDEVVYWLTFVPVLPDHFEEGLSWPDKPF
jgi:hypothetical protein